jgi:hypothetical protein
MENPRYIYGIRHAELPLLDRGSSATKTGLAVSNPRISERSDVATLGSAPAYALEYTSQDNLLQKVAGSIFFLLTVTTISDVIHDIIRHSHSDGTLIDWQQAKYSLTL